jgi:hypothetical protein
MNGNMMMMSSRTGKHQEQTYDGERCTIASEQPPVVMRCTGIEMTLSNSMVASGEKP